MLGLVLRRSIRTDHLHAGDWIGDFVEPPRKIRQLAEWSGVAFEHCAACDGATEIAQTYAVFKGIIEDVYDQVRRKRMIDSGVCWTEFNSIDKSIISNQMNCEFSDGYVISTTVFVPFNRHSESQQVVRTVFIAQIPRSS